jgi:UDP-glucose 4-epimerase
VIAIYCGAAVNGRRATVYGDGLQTRDFVYVGDVVDAFVAGALGDAVGHCNIATGRETTVLELAEALGLQPVLEPERPGEVRRSCLDPARARELIGWQARTSLEDGLARTLAAASG